MGKSILLAFSYVLQNAGFHLTCDRAFFFSGEQEIRWTRKRETRNAWYIYYPFSPRLSSTKEEETPDHRLVSIYHMFQILPQIFRW